MGGKQTAVPLCNLIQPEQPGDGEVIAKPVAEAENTACVDA